MVALFIDTSDNKKTIVKIEKDEGVVEEIIETHAPRSDIVLETIEKILKKADVPFDRIEKIFVNKGPGSFTGLRVGVSIANALSFALSISVNDLEVGKIVEPEY